MTRKLKALGLALFAVLAMSAVTAGAAQAQISLGELTSANYPATIDATTTQKIGEGNEYFEQIGRKLECEVAHFHATLVEPSTTLNVTPDYTDASQGGTCDAAGVFKVSVTENGCIFQFHTKGTDVPNVDYRITVTVDCPGNPLTVHVANAAGVDACTITVDDQDTSGTLTAKQNGNHIDLSGEVEVTSTLHSKSAALCGKNVGEHKGIVTKYVVKKPITVTGNNGKISLTDT